MTNSTSRSSDSNLHNIPMSSTLLNFLKKDDEAITKFYEIIEEFHENSFLLSLIFFAIPIALPLPYPPFFTTVMCLPLVFFSVQMILGYDKVVLPVFLDNYSIKNKTLKMISKKAVPTLLKIEKFLKPRYNFTKYVFAEKMIGFVSFLCCICIAIPLPLTNAMPAQGIIIMCLGMLGHDGLIVIFGVAYSAVGIIVATIATILSYTMLLAMFSGVQEFFYKIISFIN